MRRYEALALELGVSAGDFAQIEQGWRGLEERANRLAAERTLYAELFAAAPEAILVTDLNGVIRDINRAGAALLNLSLSNLVGKPLAAYIGVAARPDFRRHIARLALGGSPCSWHSAVHPRGKPALRALVCARSTQQDELSFDIRPDPQP